MLANDTDVDGAPVPIFMNGPQLIEVRNMVSITKAQASINEWGADYTGGDTSPVISYELWINASTLAEHNASATGILGYQFYMVIDPALVQDLNWSITSGTTFGTTNSSITFNSVTGAIAVASASAIVDTDPTNDGPPSFLGSEAKIATFYLNPVDQSGANLTYANYDTVLNPGSQLDALGNDIASGHGVMLAFNNVFIVTDIGNLDATTHEAHAPGTLLIANQPEVPVEKIVTSATAVNGTVTINADSTLNYQGNQD